MWTVEHLLKDAADVEAYLAIPDEAFAERLIPGRWKPRKRRWVTGAS